MIWVNQLIIADFHLDVLSAALEQGRDLTRWNHSGHVDLPRMERAGVDLAVFALFPYGSRTQPLWNRVLQQLQLVLRLAEDKRVQLLRRGRHLLAPARQYRPRIALSLEGACPLVINDHYARHRLVFLSQLGVQLVNPTWNYSNIFASAAMDPGRKYGLTKAGKNLIEDMNQLRMLLDVSHLSETSFWGAVEHSLLPPVASHSNAKALCDHPRNLTRAQIKAIAERRGVVGVNLCPYFLTTAPTASIDDVLSHIDYLVEVGGIDSVAIGTDFDGISQVCLGLDDITSLPLLAEELDKSGYPRWAVQKILGGNLLRVLNSALA